MKHSVKKALFLVLIFLVWILGGAWIFVLVEYKEEDDRKAKGMIMTELYHNMSVKYNITLREFTNLAHTIHDALTIPRRQWNYQAAVEFALYTITTIGYGNTTPTTPTGQILCILYVLTGIPIAMLALKSVGDLIAAGFLTMIRRVEKRLWKTAQPKHAEIKCTFVTFVSMIVFIIIGAEIQVHAEDWTFVEGIYMWFITFTTVGYGDFYPGKTFYSRPVGWNQTLAPSYTFSDLHPSLLVLSDISLMLFYILGLCLVASVLNSIAKAVEKHRYRKRLLAITRKYQLTNKSHNYMKKLQIQDAKCWRGVFKDRKTDDEIEPRTNAVEQTDNAN